MEKKQLEAMEAIFNPKAVSIIGASDNPNKLGWHVMRSVTEGKYPGKIYPVNPGKGDILGFKAYPSLSHIPDALDLAIIVLPAEQVPKTIKECHEKGVKGIILITAGFREIEDRKGESLQREITELANQFGIRVIGPNTFGIVNLHLPFNGSFTPEFSKVKKGSIAFVSQSGGMSHLFGFLSMKHQVGLSKIIGLGNRCNVDFWDMMEFLEHDQETKVMAMYLEGLDQPRRLIETARAGNFKKPLIAYKVGSSSTGDKASQFHTGSLAGKHEIYEAAFKQAGILTVNSSEELLDAAKALSLSLLPDGDRVAVLSGQAGPAMAACDVCETEGLSIPPFPSSTQNKVNALLPPLAIRTNPVDMGPAWYDAEAIRGIVRSVMEDHNTDAILLCIMFASANKPVVGMLAHSLLQMDRKKPILCCISAPEGIWDDEIRDLEESGIPNFPTPERAAKALAHLVKYKRMSSKFKTQMPKESQMKKT